MHTLDWFSTLVRLGIEAFTVGHEVVKVVLSKMVKYEKMYS